MKYNGHDLPFAQDVNYWQSGRTAVDVKIDGVSSMIVDVGGSILSRGNVARGEAEMIFIEFSLDGSAYRIAWPILPIDSDRNGKEPAARIQAATLMHHEVKSICVKAKVFGPGAAFVPYLLLENGRTVVESAAPEIAAAMPKLLISAST